MGLQAYMQLAAAEGAVEAYGTITGESRKPYVGPADNTQSVDRQVAAAELEASKPLSKMLAGWAR